MKAYPEYKSSGIDWLGEIPSHWGVISGKWAVNFTYGFPADSKLFSIEKKGLPLIRIRDIYSTDTEVYYEGDDYPSESIINNGDLLIGMDGDFNVSRWRGTRAILNQRVCKYEDSEAIAKNYMFYILPLILNEINATKYATTVKHLSATDLSEMKLTVPPMQEQAVIAAYLDDVTGKVDALIAEKQKQVEDLRSYRTSLITETVTRGLNPDASLRPSGIDWLGNIPEHWKLTKIGWLFDAKAGGDAKPDLYSETQDENHPYPVFTNTLIEHQIYAYTSVAPFKAGSITVTGRGDIGHAFIRNVDFDAIIRLVVLTPRKPQECRYFKYFIDTVIPFLSDSAAVEQLSASQIVKYFVVLPPLSEQLQIADYLDEKTAKIDTLIEELEAQLSDLATYKQAVITEVVTGKVDVRDWTPKS